MPIGANSDRWYESEILDSEIEDLSLQQCSKTASRHLRIRILGRSSLGNHLEKLELAGYIRTKVINSFAGKRQVFEITDKGLEESRILLDRIRSLDI